MFIILEILLIRNLGVLSCVVLGRGSLLGGQSRGQVGLPSSEGLPGAGSSDSKTAPHVAGRLVWAAGRKPGFLTTQGFLECPHSKAAGFSQSKNQESVVGPTMSFMSEPQKDHPSSFCHILLVTQASPIHGGQQLHKHTNARRQGFLDVGYHSPQ